MHFFSTLMVSLGSIFSSIWIVVANSWQQTPAGSHIVGVVRDGAALLRAEITDFWALVFNPSTIHRLVHVWIGAFIVGAFFIMSISAWYLLKRRHVEFARRSFTGALLLGTVASLAALVSAATSRPGTSTVPAGQARGVRGAFHHGPRRPRAVRDPGRRAQTIRANVAIPGGLSFLLHDDFSTPVLGLDRVRPEDRPPVLIPFFSYRLMVGLGTGFIAVTLLASFLRWRGRLFTTRWLLWIFVFAVAGAIAANHGGWVAAEVGRQPWVVHPPVARGDGGGFAFDGDGYLRYETAVVAHPDGSTREVVAGLRTADAVSEAVTGGQVLGSILLFGVIYLLLGALWLVVLDHKIRTGPESPTEPHRDDLAGAAGALVGHRRSMTETPEASA
jgi:cytochrome bd ubiquinol oxidase subunit I